MKLKYEFDKDIDIRIITECPYGEVVSISDDIFSVIKVGFLGCIGCKYFKNRNVEKREVECVKEDKK